jgi:hypothetical protein
LERTNLITLDKDFFKHRLEESFSFLQAAVIIQIPKVAEELCWLPPFICLLFRATVHMAGHRIVGRVTVVAAGARVQTKRRHYVIESAVTSVVRPASM